MTAAFTFYKKYEMFHTRKKIVTYFGRDIGQPRIVPVQAFVVIFLRWPNGHHGAVVAGLFFSGTMLNRFVIRDSKPCWFFPSYHIYRNLILQRKTKQCSATMIITKKKIIFFPLSRLPNNTTFSFLFFFGDPSNLFTATTQFFSRPPWKFFRTNLQTSFFLCMLIWHHLSHVINSLFFIIEFDLFRLTSWVGHLVSCVRFINAMQLNN